MIYVTNVNGIFLTHMWPDESVLSLIDWCKHILSVYSNPSKSTFPKTYPSDFGDPPVFYYYAVVDSSTSKLDWIS